MPTLDPNDELQTIILSLPERGVKIAYKSQFWVFKVLAWLLKVATFGKLSTFNTEFITTIGHTIYVPDDYEQYDAIDKVAILRHELTHVSDFEKYGVVGFSLFYLLLYFPIGLAYFRYKFERTAYINEFKVTLKYFPTYSKDALAQELADTMASADYLWCWPFKKSVYNWARAQLDQPLSRKSAVLLRAGIADAKAGRIVKLDTSKKKKKKK